MILFPLGALLAVSVIQGTVIDARSGAPLDGVRVVLDSDVGPSVEATTAADGSFTFDARSGGVLRVDHPGYRPVAVRVGELVGPLILELVPLDEALEGFLVEGVRGGRTDGAVASSALTSAAISRTFVGQEMSSVLAATPSTTSFSDAGVPAGYSYLRLRGLDQTRISVTLDGAPLNEPEDQGVYFSNFPDFANSVRSVQVQRGVGVSAFGAASYIGAVHLESVRLSEASERVEVQATAGSYGSSHMSLEATSGLSEKRVAGYGRISMHDTDGYRRHSGSRSYSFFTSAAWFGDLDQVKVTSFGGHSWNDMAYLAASESALRIDPRTNDLGDDEVDDFRQTFVSVDYTRQVSRDATWTVKGFRSDLKGKYDVRITGLWNFALTSDWSGLVSYAAFQRSAWSLDVGAHLSWYRRDHRLRIRPDLSTDLYHNAGLRGEQSAFVRAGYAWGRATVLADAQLRRSTFEYVPDAAGASLSDLGWHFFNPRLALNITTGPRSKVFASYGRTSREPTRNDLFAGFDDIGPTEAAFVGDPPAVKPETVHDVEVGVSYEGPLRAISANAFWMAFRDEIAAIGQLSYIGLPLRKNVGRSFRRGVELDWRVGASGAGLRAGGTATIMQARIEAFTDDASAVTYRDVEPLLTPARSGSAWVERSVATRLRIGVDVRFSSSSHLANDGDRRFSTPAYALADAYASLDLGPHSALVQLRNVTSEAVYTSGYHDGNESFFYPTAPRNVTVSLRLRM